MLLLHLLILVVISQEVSSNRCLQCTGVLQPRHCHTTRLCQQNEGCVTEQYRTTNGVLLYDVGCGDPAACSVKLNTSTNATYVPLCRECCHGDLCNAAGCGEPGYPSPRGPVCLNCKQMPNPELCDTVTVCPETSVCHVESIEEFRDVYYHSQCVQKSECDAQHHLPHKRFLFHDSSATTCSKCCSEDLCNSNCKSRNNSSTTDNTGTSFLLLFPPHSQDGLPVTTQLKIGLTVPTVIKLEFLHNGTTSIYHFKNSAEEITFKDDHNILVATHGIENKGALLTANHPITLAVYKVSDCCEGEAFAPLPTNFLGSLYYVVNLKSTDFRQNFLSISALENDTTVSFNFNISGPTYPSSIRLNRLQTYTINSDVDLTGTRLTSNKPIALVSGNRCSGIPHGARYCNHMTEYIYPVSMWGTQFIVPLLVSAVPGSFIRIVTKDRPVHVTITRGVSGQAHAVHGYADFPVDLHEGTTLSSSDPILVVLYAALNAPRQDGFPLMVQVPAISHYVNNALFNAKNYFLIDDLISLVARTSDMNNLLLDGFNINHDHAHSVILDSVSYTMLNIYIDSSFHTLNSTSPEAKFAVLVCGTDRNSRTYASYAYPISGY